MRSRDNEELAEQIDRIDWKITIFFYSAAHLVLARMVSYMPGAYGETSEQRAHRTHSDLFGYIRNDKHLRKLCEPYNALFQLSRRARYEVWEPDEYDLNKAVKAFVRVEETFFNTLTDLKRICPK